TQPGEGAFENGRHFGRAHDGLACRAERVAKQLQPLFEIVETGHWKRDHALRDAETPMKMVERLDISRDEKIDGMLRGGGADCIRKHHAIFISCVRSARVGSSIAWACYRISRRVRVAGCARA